MLPLKVVSPAVLHYLMASPEEPAANGRLVWVVSLGMDGRVDRLVFVDAISGEVITTTETKHQIGARAVYDGNYTTVIPGTLIFAEPGWSSDVAATTAYTHVGLAHAALAPVSLEPGMDATQYRISIRYGATAFSESQVVPMGPWYQDIRLAGGNPGHPYRPYTDSAFALDVASHEVGHIAQFWNSLLSACTVACEESGAAIAEGMADAAAIKADLANQKPSPWVVGDMFPDGLGFRSAQVPILSSIWSKDYWPQRSLWLTGEGGAHDNATILTHAYYLLANGGYHSRAGVGGVPSILVPGIGTSKAEAIFMQLLVNESLQANQTFYETRLETRDIATQLFGLAERDAVTAAWDAVGVNACGNVPAAPTLWTEAICPWWRITTLPVPGATVYNMQYSLYPNFSSKATWYSGDNQTCELSVSIYTYFRARACNACGCSPWSQNAIAHPYLGECP